MKITLTFYMDGHEYREKGVRLGDTVLLGITGWTTQTVGRVIKEDYAEVANAHVLDIEFVDCDAATFRRITESSTEEWLLTPMNLNGPAQVFQQSHPILN